MIYKTNSKYKFFFYRDFMYKTKINNVHNIACLKNFLVNQQFTTSFNYFEAISSFILLFDALPFVIKSKKQIGSKTSQVLSNIKQTLTELNFFNFLTRIKNEEAFEKENFVKTNDINFVRFSIKPGLFDEFLDLYEYFPELSDIYVSCSVVNCKNEEEKKLLVSGLLFL